MVVHETPIDEKLAGNQRGPFWILVMLFGGIIVLAHGLEQARVNGWSADWFGDEWEYAYYVIRGSRDLGFASLFVLAIWFGKKRHFVFAFAIGLGIVDLAESALIQRMFFGGFVITSNWWEWDSIDSALTVMLAVVTMPIIKWLTRSKKVLASSLSIADILLLITSIAVLIVAAIHVVNMPASIAFRGEPTPQFITDRGWDPLIKHFLEIVFLGLVAVVTVSVAFYGKVLLGVVAYLFSWGMYVGVAELTEVVKFEPKLRNWDGEVNHYLPVIAIFLVCILIARLACHYWEGSIRSKT